MPFRIIKAATNSSHTFLIPSPPWDTVLSACATRFGDRGRDLFPYFKAVRAVSQPMPNVRPGLRPFQNNATPACTRNITAHRYHFRRTANTHQTINRSRKAPVARLRSVENGLPSRTNFNILNTTTREARQEGEPCRCVTRWDEWAYSHFNLQNVAKLICSRFTVFFPTPSIRAYPSEGVLIARFRPAT